METEECEKRIRQPIITVAGHVDHGKTSILDQIRGTKIQESEAGGITQKISFTTVPADHIQKRAGKILEQFKIPLEIPGLMFIDTPGHAAFTNLRKRGGSLADIAILVIDINDGIKPQTAEVLQILKANKTPFIVALNKVDNISGWKTPKSLSSLDALDYQALNVKQSFEEKFYTIIGALHSHGFNAEIYSKIVDFTRNVAIVPCSARTGQGIAEILAVITALSQKFLHERIEVSSEGKGVVLEVKKEKSGNFLEVILYDGILKKTDEIAIASFDSNEDFEQYVPVITKIRSMQESRPLSKGYYTVKEAHAAAGLLLQINSKEDIPPGMPLRVINDNLEEIKKEFCEEFCEGIRTDRTGIMIKADSLGSLEALLVLLRQHNIRVIRAGIGPITKKDVYRAAVLPEEDRIILGFNVLPSGETISLDELSKIKVLTNPVVYKLIEDFEKWKEAKTREIEKARLSELPSLAKITILNFVFRNSNPVVFGVVVNGGIVKKGERLINVDDKKIGRIKELQEDRKNIREATSGHEIAISIPGVNFERQLKVGESLYTDLSETEFRTFKKNKDLLSTEEKSVLHEVAQIKRRTNDTWGI